MLQYRIVGEVKRGLPPQPVTPWLNIPLEDVKTRHAQLRQDNLGRTYYIEQRAVPPGSREQARRELAWYLQRRDAAEALSKVSNDLAPAMEKVEKALRAMGPASEVVAEKLQAAFAGATGASSLKRSPVPEPTSPPPKVDPLMAELDRRIARSMAYHDELLRTSMLRQDWELEQADARLDCWLRAETFTPEPFVDYKARAGEPRCLPRG